MMDATASEPEVQAQQVTPKQLKRHRKHSDDAKSHGSKQGIPPSKRGKLHPHPHSISSTRVANNIMKFRLGGSVSDPLNLEGGASDLNDGECSTCAPSPVVPGTSDQPSPLPQYLQRDPLNLEGKVKHFPAHKQTVGGGLLAFPHHLCHKTSHSHKRKHRRRSNSKSEDKESVEGKEKKSEQRRWKSKQARFRYGNYDRYYGYRNSGVREEDLRLSLLKKEWFEGKECLDIGSNTGQVTIRVARDFKPKKIVGIDIDSKLIKMAWKNLHREYVPTVAPDGRLFPQSLSMSRGFMTLPLIEATPTPVEVKVQGSTEVQEVGKNGEELTGSKKDDFPYNIEFKQCNYVPEDDSRVKSQIPEYDIILALSLTKWIHLNSGDDGIKRFFRKTYNHLRPGGRLILEPQPFSSYSKKKNITPEMSKNFQSISFFPCDFHNYLMSSDVGFTKHKLLGVPENESKGFRRPLHMYIKGSPPSIQTGLNSLSVTADSAPGIASRSHSASEDCELSPVDCTFSGKRLKSVVVEVAKNTTRTQGYSKEERIISDQDNHSELSSKVVDLPNSRDVLSLMSSDVKMQTEGNT